MTDCVFCHNPISEERSAAARSHEVCSNELDKRVSDDKCIRCGDRPVKPGGHFACADPGCRDFKGYPGP